MIDHVVVDVEIKQTIEETPGGWDATDKLGVSCAVVYEFKTDRFRVFGDRDEDLGRLRERLIKADKISGFNIWKFDFPVIFGLPGRMRAEFLREKTNDILRRIWRDSGLDPDSFSKAHGGFKLDDISRHLFGVGKVANGAEAPVMYKRGDWGALVNYCVDDVTLERDLTLFVEKHGFVIGRDGVPVYLNNEKWHA
jgi:DEAD/DEAH box helicase domain-containing protein